VAARRCLVPEKLENMRANAVPKTDGRGCCRASGSFVQCPGMIIPLAVPMASPSSVFAGSVPHALTAPS
jgi:hypothetical protein